MDFNVILVRSLVNSNWNSNSSEAPGIEGKRAAWIRQVSRSAFFLYPYLFTPYTVQRVSSSRAEVLS